MHQKERSLNHLRIQRISLPFWPSSKSNLTQFVDIHRLNEQLPFFYFKVQVDLHSAVYRDQIFLKTPRTRLFILKTASPRRLRNFGQFTKRD